MQIEPYGNLDLLELFDRLVVPTLDESIDRWLTEDLGDIGDITTLSLVSPDVETRCEVRAREHGIVSGLPILERMVARRGGSLRAEPLAADGDRIEPGMRVMEIVGPLSALLPMERTALNLLGLLSGVATATRRYVDVVAGTAAQIVDTRKTTPGLRVMEKYAVRCGGGHLHRIGLFDGVLVKDNHIAAIENDELAPAVEAIAEAARNHGGALFIEVEVDRLEQLDALLTLPDGVLDIILLDNMGQSAIESPVARRDKKRRSVLLEASGGVRLDTLRAIAESGVDRIAVGAITHSAVQVDFGLDSV